jgi:hypothetical protein
MKIALNSTQEFAISRTSRGRANISKQTNAAAVCRQKDAAETVAGEPAACGKNGYGLTDMSYHAVHKTLFGIDHDIPPVKQIFRRIVHFYLYNMELVIKCAYIHNSGGHK